MRTGALALAMLLAACDGGSGAGSGPAGRPGSGAGSASAGDVRETVATLALAAGGPGNCSARWDGQPATPQQVLDRSIAAVGQAIERAGSIANLTAETVPAVAVTAPASLAFSCVDSFLAQVRRSGVATLLLSVDGNGEAVSSDAIEERVRELSGPAAAEMETPAGELEVRPAREATYGQVHDVLRAVRSARIRAALLLPSVSPNRPSARAPLPPPRPPSTNQASGNEAEPRP